MDINKLSMAPGDDLYYTKGFMDVLESHVDYLRKSSKTSTYQVDKDIAYIYQGDFYGYLNFRNIQQRLHWITMRVNGYYSSFDFKPTVSSILVPSSQDIELIRMSYLNSGLVNF